MRENARSGEIKEHDGGNTGTNARGASEISDFREHSQQTITLAVSDDMPQCVHMFSKEPTCNKKH